MATPTPISRDNLYYYLAEVVRVYDGDTVYVNIDLGLSTFIMKEKIRLARIDAPEIRGDTREAGLRSRDFLASLVVGKQVLLQTIKDRKGKYGRYIGELWLEEGGTYQNINDRMVAEGLATYVDY